MSAPDVRKPSERELAIAVAIFDSDIMGDVLAKGDGLERTEAADHTLRVAVTCNKLAADIEAALVEYDEAHR